MFNKEISSAIEIRGSAEQVWAVLTDFEKYSQWNPFIIRAKGKAEAGQQIEGDFKPVGAKATLIRPILTKVAAAKELRWLGKIGIRGLFDAEHIFIIESMNDGQVRLIQREQFSGLLIPFFKFEASEAAFKLMNQALKERVETSTAKNLS